MRTLYFVDGMLSSSSFLLLFGLKITIFDELNPILSSFSGGLKILIRLNGILVLCCLFVFFKYFVRSIIFGRCLTFEIFIEEPDSVLDRVLAICLLVIAFVVFWSNVFLESTVVSGLCVVVSFVIVVVGLFVVVVGLCVVVVVNVVGLVVVVVFCVVVGLFVVVAAAVVVVVVVVFACCVVVLGVVSATVPDTTW